MFTLDRSQLEIKVGNYAVGSSQALGNSLLLGRVQGYRRWMSARMLALDKTGAERRLPSGDYLASKKVDGEFAALAFNGSEVIMLNPGGTVRVGLPFMEEASALLKEQGITSALIAGEFYYAKENGRPRVHDVTRAARRPESRQALDNLRFAIFDLLEWNGENAAETYVDVWQTIKGTFQKGHLIHPVETVEVKSAKDLVKHFDIWVNKEGAEGLVARSDEAGIFKVKPRFTLDVVVVGFAEGTDDRAGMIHDLLLAVMRSDGSYQIVGRVGGGFTENQRREFLSDLTDLAVASDYAEVNSERVAYQMIRPEKVAEISCLDLISQTTRGGSINRMVIRWDSDAQKWLTERRLPLASLLSPEFIRFRDDKTPRPDEVGIQQLTDLVEIQETEKTLDDLRLPKSEILSRVVYTKEIKGKTMVRKLMLWKTNKESHSDLYPAYVIYLTDFSPNRKDPLSREIRVSQNESQMKKLWDEFHEKNFVQGMERGEGIAVTR